MPKAVHDLAIKLQGKGKSEDSAWAIANSQLGKTTKNDKHVGESMDKYGEIADQSPPMTLAPVQKQNTGTWPTSMNPSYANTMGQMREDGMPGQQMPGMPCDICGGPEHPPMDHPYLPRMPNDPMAMTQQPQMPMAPLPMQAPPPMPQMPTQPPMQPNPAKTQQPPNQEGGMGSGEYPHGSGGGQPHGGPQQAPSGGGQSGGGGQGGGGDGGFGSPSMGGQRPQPGPVVSFETVRMNEAIMKQLIDGKVGCGCQKKSKKG